MLKAVILFAIGLVMLIKGGDWFVDGATGIAHSFQVPELLIGATVVSIGTTLPEVMVSATSAINGHGEIAYGNAIGSVICNTALIAALTIAIKPSEVNKKSLITPVSFFFGAAIVYSFGAYILGEYSRTIGLILLAIFVVYMVILIISAIKGEPEKIQGEEIDIKPLWQYLLPLILGAAVIAIGADLLVDNGTIIAKELGVPESVIALTFVALGTSLPELVTAITALAKGHSSLSLGNIIGANLFNLVFVSGLSITLNPFNLPTEKTIAGMNASLVVDIPVMFLVMIIMTIPAIIKGRLSRWQGILLLAIYTAFVTFQFIG